MRATLQRIFGAHTVKAGFSWENPKNFRDTVYVDGQGRYNLAPQYNGRNITAAQIAAGDSRIFGVMVESNLKAGRQDLTPGKSLEYGVSVTDACIDWEGSLTVLDTLAAAVRQRRLTLAE